MRMRTGVNRISLRGLAMLSAAALVVGSTAAGLAEDKLLNEATGFAGTIAFYSLDAPGLVIGAIRNGETAVFGYGKANEKSDAPPDGNTLIHIGSVSKVFTGAVLASLVADGTVSFTDTLASHLGDGVTVPTLDDKAITLLNLATYGAGFPREFTPPAGKTKDGATDTPELLIESLASTPLLFPPGTGILYSNYGYDLLAIALGKATGKPYDELLKERILGPVGMSDTRVNLADGDAARAFDGHFSDGSVMPYEYIAPVSLGSGSLISTANDMMKWLAWHLDRFSTKDVEMRLLDHAPYLARDGLDPVLGVDDGGPMSAMGLGWVVLEPEGNRPLVLEKSGGYVGTFTYVAMAPTRGVAVFISINAFKFAGFPGMVAVANNLLQELAPR